MRLAMRYRASSACWSDSQRSILAPDIDGAVVPGSTADVLRSVTALRWLATRLAERGQHLAAGEIVLTGSLVRPTPIVLPAKSVAIRMGSAP
jgi:2-keto-4-pentenoate hydratase